MTVQKLRELYVKFFESKGHTHFPSGSLVPYDVTGRLDESLLFNGAGMVQFKPYFRGVATPPNKRLVTVQKCVRTGDIEIVGDNTHLTFFEMLGNFSFGDYFKSEAIRFSWEFMTSSEWLGLDPKRLSFTVFTEDDEAFGVWNECMLDAGLDPSQRVFRLGEDTNYWPAGAFSKGPPGPCGPNSEMFYWVDDQIPPPTGEYGAADFVRDEEAGLWMEIWNDVFIQYEWQGEYHNPERPNEGYRKTAMPELPFRSIDTGMGLERTAVVLGGFKSVYDTDAFRPIIGKIESLMEGYTYGSDAEKDRAIRVICDHIRTASFCIADGILPGTTGRGYVLRRLIRRGVLKGQRVLGFQQPFFHHIYSAVRETMGSWYGTLVDQQALIEQTLMSEEILFRGTLNRGLDLLQGMLEKQSGQVLDGNSAFMLYDTFGFPLEVTQEVCAEAGYEVDIEGFESAMLEAQRRSRGASGMDNVYGDVMTVFDFSGDGPTPTQFLGYEYTEIPSVIVGALPELDTDGRGTGRIALALSHTPFYAESGGQVSDSGNVFGENFELKVLDLIKQDGVYVHLVEPTKTAHPVDFAGLDSQELVNILYHQFFNKEVVARVDERRRDAICRNHTATHLLHAALRTVLGKHVTQQGSSVSPDHLRFDFSHTKAITPSELETIEAMVQEEILRNESVVTYVDIPLAEAKARGAMALFGEKYADFVRMVEIGDFSRELCGGIHVEATGQIGFFKVTSESSAASGVRRIEAVTGLGAVAWANEQARLLRTASAQLKTSPKELLHSIEKLQDQLREERKKREKLAQQGAGEGNATTIKIGEIELITQKLDGAEQKDAQLVVDRLIDNQPHRVAVVAAVNEGKIAFVCKVGPKALDGGAHAGNILREVAKIAGGGGGGKADFATAGGRDASKVDEALAASVTALPN